MPAELIISVPDAPSPRPIVVPAETVRISRLPPPPTLAAPEMAMVSVWMMVAPRLVMAVPASIFTPGFATPTGVPLPVMATAAPALVMAVPESCKDTPRLPVPVLLVPPPTPSSVMLPAVGKVEVL